MTDIVERLRAEIADLKSANELLHGLVGNRDAEIERLRPLMAGDAAEIRRLLSEIERLHIREARITELLARNEELRERIKELTRERDALWEQDRYSTK